MELTILEWASALFIAFLVGISKSGIKGITPIIVTVMVLLFGAKASTGIVLVMFITGDVLAVNYYKRHANWRLLWRLMPFMVVGVLLGTWFGKDLDEETFRYGMAAIILVSVAMMVWLERRSSDYVPDNLWFAGILGLAAGFTTMIGNLAGAFSNLYFLAMRSPKNEFIGTAAWLFFIINLFKVPFHIWVWGTISWESLFYNLTFIPPLVIGFFLGVRGVKYFKDDQYRKFVIVMTAIGALLILFQ